MKIAYFGYDFFFSCLEKLLEHGHEVCWVFTYPADNRKNFNTRVIETAKGIGAELKTEKATTADIEGLRNEGCDLIVSAAYPYRIPVLTGGMPRAINIHPTLLPEGRGPWPLPWIVLKGLRRSGVTIHKIEEAMDAGDVLLQEAFEVMEYDDLETLSCKSQMLASKLVEKFVDGPDQYWDNAISQDEGRASYWPMPGEAEWKIDWSGTVGDILRTVRAFGKFDSAAHFDGQEWIVQDASAWKEPHSFRCGTVAHRSMKEVVIAAKDGFVCLRFFEPDPDS